MKQARRDKGQWPDDAVTCHDCKRALDAVGALEELGVLHAAD